MSKPVFPTLKVPSVNVEALVALQKANLETAVQAQAVITDAVKTITELQTGLVEDTVRNIQALTKVNLRTKPEVYFADVKAATKRVFDVAREELGVGLKAQNEVAQLVSKRAAANIAELKAITTVAA